MKRTPILLAFVLILFGCGEARIEDRIGEAINPAGQPVSAEATKATPAESRLASAQAALRQAQQDVQTAKVALEDERTEAAQSKIWWFVGIMSVLALLSAGLAIFIPSVARWAIRLALAAGAVAALAVFAAWLLPYLWWIGGGLSLVGAVGAVVYWRLDAKSRDQVLKAVDAVKDRVPDFKATFRQHIDEDADMAINKARNRLGLK